MKAHRLESNVHILEVVFTMPRHVHNSFEWEILIHLNIIRLLLRLFCIPSPPPLYLSRLYARLHSNQYFHMIEDR